MVLVVDLKIHIKSGIFSIVFNERMVILYVDRSGSCGNTQDLEFFGEYSGACSTDLEQFGTSWSGDLRNVGFIIVGF